MTHEADMINGLFESVGATLGWINFSKLRREKMIRGVYWPFTAFFFSWGAWSVFYYATLGQWYSVTGAAYMVSAHMAWLWLAIKYRNN